MRHNDMGAGVGVIASEGELADVGALVGAGDGVSEGVAEIVGVMVMVAFVRNAMRIESFTAPQ